MTYDENGKTFSLHIDTCGNLTVYMILKIKIADECALAKILDAKSVKFEIEIFGKDNATIEELSPHIEDWKIVDECTRKYDGSVSVDTDEDKTEDVTPEEKPEKGTGRRKNA